MTGGVGHVGVGSLADRLGGPHGAATVTPVQLAGAIALFPSLVGTDDSFALITAVFVTLGLTIHNSAGVFYSYLSGVVGDGDIRTAIADGQTALSIGGLVTPPLFGFVMEPMGHRTGWVLVTGSTVLMTVLLFIVRRRI